MVFLQHPQKTFIDSINKKQTKKKKEEEAIVEEKKRSIQIVLLKTKIVFLLIKWLKIRGNFHHIENGSKISIACKGL